MQRKIVKAKLTNNDKVEVSFQEIIGEEGEFNEVDMKCQGRPHPDLVAAFKELDIHLATLCEQGEFTDFEDNPDKLTIFHVTQISIGGEDEHEGVTLTGMRTLKENRVLNLNAPFCKLNPDHSHYSYVSSLALAINHALAEVDEYLNGKHAPSNQLNLFDNPEEEAEEVVEEKPKRRARKLGKDHPIVKGLGEDSEIEVTVEV